MPAQSLCGRSTGSQIKRPFSVLSSFSQYTFAEAMSAEWDAFTLRVKAPFLLTMGLSKNLWFPSISIWSVISISLLYSIRPLGLPSVGGPRRGFIVPSEPCPVLLGAP